jgi:hypothetical protein
VKVLHERVAGIDVHKDMIKVAIRSPREKPQPRKTEVFEFRTFYGVLQETGRLLRHRGVTHVAVEASGVYTDPVYYALTELDFTEVIVVSPAHVKALKGHKTARDCARLAELVECGLLHGSFIPSAEHRQVRDLTRYRMKVVQARAPEIPRARCGRRASRPACRRRWPPGSPITTRCCAACTGTRSSWTTTRSPGWTGRSRAGRAGGRGSWACSRACPGPGTWCPRPGWARSAPGRTGGSPRTTSSPAG